MINLTREEQETVILGNAAAQTWEVVTSDPRIKRKMERQGYQPDPRTNPWGYCSYTVPFGRIRILKAEKRKMSETELARRREAMKRLRAPDNYRALGDQNDQALAKPLPETIIHQEV